MKKYLSFILLTGFFTAGILLPASSLTAQDVKYDAYLFAYFEGSDDKNKQEQLRFGVSADAINWFTLNNNQPVIPSGEISQTGGIRDPHILRGDDGKTFYMTATDMFTVKNGWDSNPGIVMLRSGDLIHWTHSIIDLAKVYPKKFGNVKWVWAPQTVYDPKVKKYLVYFTVRFHGDNKLDFYSAYANKDFTGFEKEPRLMFSPKYGGIDGDIIYKDGLYHFFYKGNTKDENGKEIKNGIRQATAKSLQGVWKEDFKYLDAYADTSVVVEGSSVFKLNNSDEYILMYDLYTSGRYEFQRSTDLYNFISKPESFVKNFNPRHGSVIGITREEVRRLHARWGGVPASLLQPAEQHDRYHFQSNGNPVITHHYTADPAALVKNDTLWLFTGHDFEGGQKSLKMKDWLVFSTTDLKNWTEYPVPLRITDFAWAKNGDAYAGQAIERNGKYYWYISTNTSGVGVAVANRPEGPYKDALGKPLLTNKDCFASTHSWACIDPAVFIDNDGQAWLFWGNGQCYYAKLKENMIEIDGEIKQVQFDGFVFEEAPWIHIYNGKYYLSYASGFPEKTAYAIADKIDGPYQYKGILNEIAGNSNTNHQSIVEFKGEWYFFYHNGSIQRGGGSNSRSVCIDKLYHNPDSSIKRIQMTSEGVDVIPAQPVFTQWAKTPPMGWNSWDCYGPTVEEHEVKANADYMAEHLKPYGWEYIVVDIRWFVENDKAGGYNQTDPRYVMDEYGRYLPAINRFPSAAGNKGFKPLADYVHSKGLKFGIHIMRGVPKQAVEKKLPIKGTPYIANQIYSTDLQCEWLRDNYTVADKPGAQEYYNSIMELYASWGVDFLKIDDLSRPYHKREIEMIRRAIDRCGRPIVLSVSPGETPVDEVRHVKNHVNMWRMVDDVWDTWGHLTHLMKVAENWYPYISPTYPDCDMIPLGRISIRGERGKDRMTRLTRDEQYSLMTFFTIFRSPLMFGGDLPSNDEFTLSLLTNPEVLKMHRESTDVRQLFQENGKVAITSRNAVTGERYLAMFNISDSPEPMDIRIDLQSIGISGKCTIKNMWTGESANVAGEVFSVTLRPHECRLFTCKEK